MLAGSGGPVEHLTLRLPARAIGWTRPSLREVGRPGRSDERRPQRPASLARHQHPRRRRPTFPLRARCCHGKRAGQGRPHRSRGERYLGHGRQCVGGRGHRDAWRGGAPSGQRPSRGSRIRAPAKRPGDQRHQGRRRRWHAVGHRQHGRGGRMRRPRNGLAERDRDPQSSGIAGYSNVAGAGSQVHLGIDRGVARITPSPRCRDEPVPEVSEAVQAPAQRKHVGSRTDHSRPLDLSVRNRRRNSVRRHDLIAAPHTQCPQELADESIALLG